MGCPAHWFKHRLGMALGIMALGSSCGGTIFPIIIRNLINAVGCVLPLSPTHGTHRRVLSFQWTMRIIGFLEIVLVLAMVVVRPSPSTDLFLLRADILTQTVERRLPPRRHTGPFISFEPFKSTPFTLYSISSFICFLGIYTVRSPPLRISASLLTTATQCLTYLEVSAVSEGISDDFAFYLLAIANGCSAIGRVVGGYFADRAGPLNIMTPATILAGVLTYIWPFATSVGGNIGIAIVYGYVTVVRVQASQG